MINNDDRSFVNTFHHRHLSFLSRPVSCCHHHRSNDFLLSLAHYFCYLHCNSVMYIWDHERRRWVVCSKSVFSCCLLWLSVVLRLQFYCKFILFTLWLYDEYSPVVYIDDNFTSYVFALHDCPGIDRRGLVTAQLRRVEYFFSFPCRCEHLQ